MNKELAARKFQDALDQHENVFEKFFLARFFDLRFQYEDERCIVKVPVEDYMFNPQGSLHGGIIGFILDVSMGHLCRKILGAAVTVEMKVQYLRPVKQGIITCEASFLKKGSKLISLESRMMDEDNKLVALGTSTWFRT